MIQLSKKKKKSVKAKFLEVFNCEIAATRSVI